MTEAVNGAAVMAYARAWLGTPYVPGGAARGRGADCGGFIRGLLAEVSGVRLPPVPAPGSTRPDGRNPVLDAARRHLIHRPGPRVLPPVGAVIAFRIGEDRVAHVGVATVAGVIHADEAAGVVEVAGLPWAVASIWSMPCAPGCDPGCPASCAIDLLAVIEPTAAGYVVQIQDQWDATPLARSAPHLTAEAALASVPPSIVNVERID